MEKALDLSNLSFTALRNGKQLPKYKKGEFPRCFWNVQSTGNFREDCALGEKLALEFLAYEEADRGGPGHLNHIVNDMPRPLTAVENTFLQMVCFQAKAGRGFAACLVGDWRAQA